MRFLPLLLLPLLLAAEPPSTQFLDFVKQQAKTLREKDTPPATLADWQKQRTELRAKLLAAWGGFPEKPCPLDVQKHGELKRDGYTVEKITIQTRPGVRMTANAYVPDKKGKLPAILMVHGHWKGAKQDPVVQSRCIGAAKLGFFVLCVDAFGAGERGVGKALGEYHGEMTAATLLPVGLPLSGLQVYENMRAVDYLLTRPEVDGDRIGITGASGGGNQTMYAAAMDERLKAAVPVCSVGNYQAYLGAACCLCEVVPGALQFTEESGLLSMVAPRALMIVSATRDAPQFSVDAAKVSIGGAKPVFKLFDKEKHLQHTIFESGHDYSKPMREAMYGWMTLHLKGEGDGGPIKEPAFTTEDPEALRCYPGTTRPGDFVTLPKFAAMEAKKLLAKAEAKPAEEKRTALVKVLGGFAAAKVQSKNVEAFEGVGIYDDEYEPGLKTKRMLRFEGDVPVAKRSIVILLTMEKATASIWEYEKAALLAGAATITFDLRATRQYSYPRDTVGRAADHNTAEWSLWLGRPLLGQWVYEVRQLLNDIAPEKDANGNPPSQKVIVIGEGPAGLIALAAAATDARITKAVAINTLASFVSDEPYVNQRLGTMAPGILREVGDVAHLAALAAPKRVVIAGGVNSGGKAMTAEQLRTAYRPTTATWESLKAKEQLRIEEKLTPAELLKALE
ncbi:alpha/beta hydrolase family protein [Limnoglobus roseus]|uniref:Putative alpha/beta-hydrolase-type carbohydrate esterase (Acetyl xylan esterase) n=1 Tax=Limnoglobus roseus TaxID=2598579 RepID=A0A5C1A7F8_9BACT|nr:acetylxylan esterase [Limnoglobus roseus]QEL15219.1 putative alpha/beta-hydrolase-type carbohydrate esterase (acetyl xylan esterase) [Limnoglobus roseus]